LKAASTIWNADVVSAPKTVGKALALLNLVADRPGLTLSELSRESQLPLPTAHRLLRTLEDHGLLRQDTTYRYRLGSHCLSLGSRFLEGVDLRSEAHPRLTWLVEVTGETAHVGVPDGVEVVYVDKVETRHPVRMYSRIGARSPMHSTAMGKAMLAFGEPELVQRVIDAGLPRRTPNTITDPRRFLTELKRTRERGYAIDDIENEEGIRCVGAPILAEQVHTTVGAVSVSGPATRITGRRLSEIASAVVQAAAAVSDRLGYHEEGGLE
jgi:DNA-binding IclR family transcriptional regulator